MKTYIITERADRDGSIKVRVSTGRSHAKAGCTRKLACSNWGHVEQRLNELAGTYAVVMEFANDQEALIYARQEQAAK